MSASCDKAGVRFGNDTCPVAVVEEPGAGRLTEGVFCRCGVLQRKVLTGVVLGIHPPRRGVWGMP